MIKLMRTHLAPYLREIAFVIVLLLVQAITNLYLPTLNADIINNGVAKGDTAYIIRVGGLMVVVTGLLGVASIASVYWGSKVAMSFGRDVRSAIFRRVEAFSAREVNTFGAPSLITRNTNDVQQVQMLIVHGFTVIVLAPIMAIGGIVMALRLDLALSVLLAVILPVMAGVIAFMVRRAMPLFQSMQAKIDRVNQVMREKLSGVRVIRAFVRTRHEEHRFDQANTDLTSTQLSVNRLFAVMIPLVMAVFNFSTVAIIWFGAYRVDSGAMPIGDLTAFLSYIMQILFSLMMAVFMFVIVPRAAASAARIQEVLDTEPSVWDPEEPVESFEGRGHIEFRDVSFGYPGAQDRVLCGVSFTARPGETTAIVGSTGSGKTTLINLIPRFYDVTGGAVIVDGVDIREMSRETLWSKIGFVHQKAFLFTGTVASNLRYGRADASEAELWHALEVAQAKDFVVDMPDGLEALITQGGTNVSGGQRQRLAIARALIKRPEIYVFDDSFSALDFKTDAKLRAALRKETRDATVLIVAQRVSTIMDADRIIVMEGGIAVGMGTHDELLATNETYREIVYSQLEREEVA